jgi:hypothetical protein
MKVKTVDGCTLRCRLVGELVPGAELGWWIVFGLVASDGKDGWKGESPSSYFGHGSLRKGRAAVGPMMHRGYAGLAFSPSAAVGQRLLAC